MKAQVDKVIDSVFPSLGQKSRKQILDLCEEYTVSAGYTFVEKNKRDSFEYFLVDGVARSCLMNQDGELITLLFFEESSIISPHVTRTENGRSLINIEAITECRLFRLPADRFEKLIEQNLEVREFANTVLRRELFQKTSKEIRLISWTSRERLEQFRKDYHMLENRIPHPMIASYLGITNVSLSRLRKSH